MTAVWRNGDYTVPTQRRKQREAHGEAGKDRRGVCGHGLVGLRAFGSPRGLDLESQRVEWRSIDHHDERLDHLTCFCTNNLLPVPSFARAHQLYKLCTWIFSFVCKMDKRLGHASCSAWCMVHGGQTGALGSGSAWSAR